MRTCISMLLWVCSVLSCPLLYAGQCHCWTLTSLICSVGSVIRAENEYFKWQFALVYSRSHPCWLATASQSIFVILVTPFSHSDKNLKVLICSNCLFPHLFSNFINYELFLTDQKLWPAVHHTSSWLFCEQLAAFETIFGKAYLIIIIIISLEPLLYH